MVSKHGADALGLDLVILDILSSLTDSMILWPRYPVERKSLDQSLQRCPQGNGLKSTGNLTAFFNTHENPH